jgi:excisionase family DNA binding protein
MSTAYIPNKQELENLVQKAVEKSVNEAVPAAVRKATRKEWLTTDDVMELLQVSRRHVQHLRDSNQLSYSQSGHRTIRYHIDDVEEYLNNHKIKSKQN